MDLPSPILHFNPLLRQSPLQQIPLHCRRVALLCSSKLPPLRYFFCGISHQRAPSPFKILHPNLAIRVTLHSLMLLIPRSCLPSRLTNLIPLDEDCIVYKGIAAVTDCMKVFLPAMLRTDWLYRCLIYSGPSPPPSDKTTLMGPKKHEDLELAYGAGHINPGYNSTTLRSVTGDNSSCNNTELGRAWDLDYPSFSLAVEDGKPIIGVFTRTVTNVGSANSTYTAYITTPAMCTVEVEPSTLSFSTIGGREPSK